MVSRFSQLGLVVVFALVASIASAQNLVEKTSFGDFESANRFEGNQWWFPQLPFSVGSIETRDWTPDASEGLGSKYFLFNSFASFGIGQWIDPTSSDLQLMSLDGFVSAGGSAIFGITYYDGAFNEIHKVQAPIKQRGNATRGNGDGMQSHSLGAEVPGNAVYALAWVWKTSTGQGVAIDNFQVFDYVAPGSEDLVRNGDFATGDTTFWENDDPDGSVIYGRTVRNQDEHLQMGDEDSDDVIYQEVLNVQGNQNYDFSVRYWRGGAGGTGTTGPPYSSAGIDFFDANFNRIGGGSVNLNGPGIPAPGTPGSGPVASATVYAPAGTVHAYAWVWIDEVPTNPGDPGDFGRPFLQLQEVSLTPQ